MSMHPSLLAVSPSRPPASPGDLVWRLTLQQYHDMIHNGILGEDDPVELLEGWLITKMSKNPPHSIVTGLIADALQSVAPTGWHIRGQEPITLADSEPEPDLALARGSRRDYLNRHPGAADVALTIEVADTSLDRDRTFKLRIYAEASIPTYWIINLIERRVEVHTDPTGPSPSPGYRSTVVFRSGESIPLFIGGQAFGPVPVDALLP